MCTSSAVCRKVSVKLFIQFGGGGGGGGDVQLLLAIPNIAFSHTDTIEDMLCVTGDDYYPFTSKFQALAFMLVNNPRPLVRYNHAMHI